MPAQKNILLIVTGSIAAFKAAALASKLAQAGFKVPTVMSESATQFVGAATFEGLTGKRPLLSTFEAGSAMAHIHLAREADLVLVYPASANTLTMFASGQAPNLVGTLFLAMDLRAEAHAPIWIAPAMNPTMYAHPAVQEATQKLAAWGCQILEPTQGSTACGEVGQGRLVEPDDMFSRITAHFEKTVSRETPALKRENILITAGGTSEPVDSVRVLSNTSTGETGVKLANSLSNQGAKVTLLLSRSSPHHHEVSPQIVVRPFETSEDLDTLLKTELAQGCTTTLIHAAAVSDYKVDRIENASGEILRTDTKIGTAEGLTLRLKAAPKLLSQVRSYTTTPLKVISFKLATSADSDLSSYPSDAIVFNQVSGVERGTPRHSGRFYVRSKSGFNPESTFTSKSEMAKSISDWIQTQSLNQPGTNL